MIYESQVRRSQANPAGSSTDADATGTSNAMSAALKPIEDALQRGVDFARANPLVAVAGATAVGALVVLAARKATPRRDDAAIDRIRHDLERFVDRHRNDVSGMGQALSSALNRVMEAEPQTLAMLRKAGERMMTRAADTLKVAAGR